MVTLAALAAVGIAAPAAIAAAETAALHTGGSQLVATADAQERVPPRTFTVVAKNLSKENKYVKSVTLNGKSLDAPILRHADIMRGGELVFEMTATP